VQEKDFDVLRGCPSTRRRNPKADVRNVGRSDAGTDGDRLNLISGEEGRVEEERERGSPVTLTPDGRIQSDEYGTDRAYGDQPVPQIGNVLACPLRGIQPGANRQQHVSGEYASEEALFV
jgi:hypothetical protein